MSFSVFACEVAGGQFTSAGQLCILNKVQGCLTGAEKTRMQNDVTFQLVKLKPLPAQAFKQAALESSRVLFLESLAMGST